MSMLVWVMMAIAIWHFTIWLPDRFVGGIVGAFVAAVIGAIVFGLIVNGGTVPGRHDTHLASALEAIPGAVIGLALCWLWGARRETVARRSPRRA